MNTRRGGRKRSIVQGASVAGAALAMICGMSGQAAAAPAAPVSFIRPQSLSPGNPPAGAAALGAVPGSSQIDFDVVLAPSHQGELQTMYHDLYDPSSPLYHQWLRPGQYQQLFGPSSSEVASVESWLRGRASPMSPMQVSRSRRPDRRARSLRHSAPRSSDTEPTTDTRATWLSEPRSSPRHWQVDRSPPSSD